MASRYWVGGSGTWDGSTTTHWSATTGGTGGASVPTSTDDVFLDTNSSTATVTISSAVCQSFDCTGFTGSVGGTGLGTFQVYGSFKLVTGMTFNIVGLAGLQFLSTSTGNTITSAGKVAAAVSGVSFAGLGGGWTLQDAFSASSGQITLQSGTLDTNGQAVSAANLASLGVNAMTLTLGASTVTLGALGQRGRINISNPNFVLNAGTSLIQIDANSQVPEIVSTPTLNFYDVSFGTIAGYSGIAPLTGTFTFHNLTVNCPSSKIYCGLSISSNITVSGTFTATGSNSSGNNRPIIMSGNLSATVQITAAIASLTRVDFMDIVGAGAATWSGTSVGDCTGNSGITFTGAVTRFWVATGGGNWQDTSAWSTSTGGTSGASVPLPQDTATFDGNSGSGSVNINSMPRICAITSSGAGTPSISTGSSNPTWLFGSITLKTTMLFISSGAGLYTKSRGTQTITVAGGSMNAFNSDNRIGATTLGDAMQNGGINHLSGTLNLGTFTHTFTGFSSNTSQTRTLNMSSSTMQITGSGAGILNINASNLTLNEGTSTVKFIESTGSAIPVCNATLHNLWVAQTGSATFQMSFSSGSAGNINLSGDFKINPGRTVTFAQGITVTAATFTLVGTAGNLITLRSTNSSVSYNFVKTSGTVSADYIDYQRSTVGGGATWYALSHSVDSGNNVGWTVIAANAFYQNVSAVTGATYQINITVGGAVGFVTVALGTNSFIAAAGGTTTQQLTANGPILSVTGSPTFNSTADSISVKQVLNNYLLVVYNGVAAATLYYYNGVVWAASNLTNLTNNERDRFSVLGSYAFVTNEADGMFSSPDGATWTAGAAANCIESTDAKPSLIFRYKQRLLAAGDPVLPDRVYFSSVIDPTASPFITWNTNATTGDWIDVNPDDGGNITGFAENSTFLLVFKNTGFYRMDTVSKTVDPDNIFDVGAISQEVIVTCMGVTYYFSGTGIYRTNGGYPEQISRAGVQDIIDAMTPPDWVNVRGGSDGMNVYYSLGDVTINRNQTFERTLHNVWLKFSPRDQSWSVHTYRDYFGFLEQYTNGDGSLMRGASNAGTVQSINLGTSDDGTMIPFYLETQDQEMGDRAHLKGISDLIGVYTNNGLSSSFGARQDGGTVKPIIMSLNKRVNVSDNVNLQGNYFNFVWSGTSTGAPPIFEGYVIESIQDQGFGDAQGESSALPPPETIL